MIGWDNVSELRPPTGPLFVPRVICDRCKPWWWWWCRLGITPDSSTRTLWKSYQQTYLGQVGGRDEGVRILPFHYPKYLKGSLTCCKILWHRTSGFTSHPKEGVLRICIALKSASPWPGSNPLFLGPVVSTLTATPPKRHCSTKSQSQSHVTADGQ
jgi:hypothetical protein